MIFYDSHKWRTLVKIRGSVFPKAFLIAIPSSLLAFAIRWLEAQGWLDLNNMAVLSQGSVYSGFTFVLGVSVVFRTSQAYSRYWASATSVHEMGSEWIDACASLIAFVQNSRKPRNEVHRFSHTMVRLFSLMHAMALEEIASLKDENFPLIDIEGFNQEDLSLLSGEEAQGNKVQVIMSWIKVYIAAAFDCGLLNVPAPILTRVFQELGAGQVRYHDAQQVAIWPFPFPYTQMNMILIYMFMVVTPIVIGMWDVEPWVCSIFTLISCVCLLGLDLIASELENPFGDDPNDLPCMEMQIEINHALTLMLNPRTWQIPKLLPTAHTDYDELIEDGAQCRLSMSLQQYKMEKPRSVRSGNCRDSGTDNWRRWGQKGRAMSSSGSARTVRSPLSPQSPFENILQSHASNGSVGTISTSKTEDKESAVPSVPQPPSCNLLQDLFVQLCKHLEDHTRQQSASQDLFKQQCASQHAVLERFVSSLQCSHKEANSIAVGAPPSPPASPSVANRSSLGSGHEGGLAFGWGPCTLTPLDCKHVKRMS